MQGLDFKHALRDELALLTEPPPMNETEMLDAAKKALRRRKAAWASAGSAVAVVVLAVGVAFTVSADDRAGPAVTTTPTASPTDGEQTETAGPLYDKGVKLLDELVFAVQAGLETPADLDYVGPPLQPGDPPRDHQVVTNWAFGTESRHYGATMAVGKDGQLATLHVEVITLGEEWIDGREGCALADAFWNPEGVVKSTCQNVPARGTTAYVATATSAHRSFDQWAAYRHADGVAVFVGQSRGFSGSDRPAMAQLPLTPHQLAELAVDPRFNLD